MSLSQPHGGTLINRWNPDFQFEGITETVELDEIASSDLDLIGTGAYSPLSGFLDRSRLQFCCCNNEIIYWGTVDNSDYIANNRGECTRISLLGIL